MGLLLIVAFVLYAWQNKSGHTGIQPYSALRLFVPVALLGCYLLVTSVANGKSMKWGIISLVIGLIGVALLVYLDKSHTLQSYGDWAKWNG